MKLRSAVGLIGLIAFAIGLYLLIANSPQLWDRGEAATGLNFFEAFKASVLILFLCATVSSKVFMLVDAPTILVSGLASILFLVYLILAYNDIVDPTIQVYSPTPQQIVGSVILVASVVIDALDVLIIGKSHASNSAV